MTPAAVEGLKPAITLSDNALNHLRKMRSERGQNLCLRIGVKQGGCSGMSYTMDFENKDNARPDDSTIEYEGFTIGKISSDYFHIFKSYIRLLFKALLYNICRTSRDRMVVS